MTRDLTAAMVTEVTADRLVPILIAKMEFDSGDLRVWSGYGDLTFASETYTGTGDLGSVEPTVETLAVAAPGAAFTMSGIPSSLISTALAEDYQERTATMWLGALDQTTGALISEPTILFRGRMDVMTIDEGPETATITVTAENRLIDLEIPKVRRYTAEDQKQEFSGDTGLDQVATLQDAEVIWGRR